MAKKEEVKIDMSTQEGKLKALQAAMSKIDGKKRRSKNRHEHAGRQAESPAGCHVED